MHVSPHVYVHTAMAIQENIHAYIYSGGDQKKVFLVKSSSACIHVSMHAHTAREIHGSVLQVASRPEPRLRVSMHVGVCACEVCAC